MISHKNQENVRGGKGIEYRIKTYKIFRRSEKNVGEKGFN